MKDSEEDFEFAEEIFGGSVPKQYIPAVEKGLRDSMVKGVFSRIPSYEYKSYSYMMVHIMMLILQKWHLN